MKNDLKERYIYAVTRHLPVKVQADVERELEGLISEMLDERRGNNSAPSEQDLRDVLTELGTPEELALKYCGDERTALISGTYFLMYKRILGIVLPIVAASIAGLSIIGFILGTEILHINMPFINITAGYNPLLMMFPNIIGTMIQAFAIITIIFAVLDYRKAKLTDGDMLTNLPEMPDTKTKIKPGEVVFGIIFSVFFAILLIGFPQIIAVWSEDTGWIPVFDVAVLRGLWLPIISWVVITIIAEVVRLIEGRITTRLAAVTTVANILIAICAIVVFGGFGSNELINPAFVSFMEGIFATTEVTWLLEAFAQINLVLLGIILIALAIETIYTLVKAFLSRRS
ncbi:MAG: hypothetical protein FWC76_07755 [Defluviitaleaceae bacterium]|nr:hypothetical protein [Defluviitaleaceae bacterium]